ncbi:MAG: methylated-DNA-[protein]-cysteine S-methyltransferase [Thermoplasmata archaeon]|jgi:methylated-DNA-[protein]-cysteine S-methyltransferase|nr:methylated-DNA-[protein]-cysteine S-methyltransferase [Thermoplasmata archaeon]
MRQAALRRIVDPRACLPWGDLFVTLQFAGDRLAQVRIVDRPEPATPLAGAPREAADLVAQFLADGKTDLASLDVDLAGVSPFDQEALRELRRVRAGQTVTYGDLAKRLGKGPGASRAVGGAMARNPLPIVIPCHRVVQAGGALGHYSGFGGVATKLRLLQLEGSRW